MSFVHEIEPLVKREGHLIGYESVGELFPMRKGGKVYTGNPKAFPDPNEDDDEEYDPMSDPEFRREVELYGK